MKPAWRNAPIARGIAVKLGKLVAIDFEVVVPVRNRACRSAHERQQHRKHRARGENDCCCPEEHRVSIDRRRFHAN